MFRLVALVVMPLFCLAAMETALRIAGYGYPTAFFQTSKIGNEKVVIENDRFGRRFFPRQLTRRPLPLSFNAKKPADTYRIFVLGESAAMGDPDPAFAFSRILEVLLHERFSGTRFEVINVAFTAINSHAILPIARECAGQNGDLWVVYMGNNEVLGPFGAGTVFSSQSPHLSIIRTTLALKRLRLGQMMDQMVDHLLEAPSQTRHWTGMQMFLEKQIRHDDARLGRVYEHFQRNLTDILRLGVGSGARIVVSTVVSNLRSCAPFASLHGASLPEDRISEWKKIFEEAGALEAAGQYLKAIGRYLMAERLDSTYAELQFRLGRCYGASSNMVEAQRRVALARDLDTLRFRADSRLNSIIREVSAHRAREGIYLTDANDLMSRANSDGSHGSPGDEFFFDHVHFTFEGNYLLARILSEQILAALPSRIREKDIGNWASGDLCARRLALTGWNRYRMHESMQRRLLEAPFSTQLSHAARQQRYQRTLAELRPALQPAALQQAVEDYREALSLAPQDPLLHENLAKLLMDRADFEAAITNFRRVTELMPHHPSAYYNVGHLLIRQGKASEAEPYFRKALRIDSDYGEAYNGLGSVFASQGKTHEAFAHFTKALQLKPSLWEAHQNLGLTLEELGRTNQAVRSYTEAVQLNPDSYAAHLRLGNLLTEQGNVMSAMKHLTEAVKLQPEPALAYFAELLKRHPDDALAHFKYANALASLNKRTEAEESLRKAVQLKAEFWEARYLLGVELAAGGKIQEARDQFREVVRFNPDFALGHLNLGVALAKQSNLVEAAAQFRETLRLQPSNDAARKYLKTIESLVKTVQ